ncbi:hypothetical protein ACFC08_28535 [Streptomyces sp. NPDC056112]|uniref:hypothetical protein n=1 Tax=Streptomyces sp. NPDC056112 TaxID=3345715 RepID=UPI0035E08637
MAVMTHASARLEADYTALSPALQATIDDAMRNADNAGTYDSYTDAMKDVAIAAGIPLPASRDLAVCDCLNADHGCGCGAIFDTALPGLVVTATADPKHNLSRLQCQLCAHDHPRPIAD